MSRDDRKHDREYHDREYFERRAETELRRAQESDNPAVVNAHYLLAELHLERASRCAPASVRSEAVAVRRQ